MSGWDDSMRWEVQGWAADRVLGRLLAPHWDEIGQALFELGSMFPAEARVPRDFLRSLLLFELPARSFMGEALGEAAGDAPIVAHMKEAFPTLFKPNEHLYLEAQLRAKSHRWEVTAIDRGTSFDVESATGERRRIYAPEPSLTIRHRSVHLARIIEVDGVSIITSQYPEHVSPLLDAIVAARASDVRRRLDRRRGTSSCPDPLAQVIAFVQTSSDSPLDVVGPELTRIARPVLLSDKSAVERAVREAEAEWLDRVHPFLKLAPRAALHEPSAAHNVELVLREMEYRTAGETDAHPSYDPQRLREALGC